MMAEANPHKDMLVWTASYLLSSLNVVHTHINLCDFL